MYLILLIIIMSIFTSNAKKITLTVSKSCPYACRAWISCIEAIPNDFILNEVDLQDKSIEFKDLYASINPVSDDSAKVPILENTETGFKMIESKIIGM